MYHYDAFISYNHNPRDIKTAASLQRLLENYRIPRGVRTSGKQRIERVFLDKGELEVAGDLNEIICNALENSDNLIVICSPESHESIWVKKEIEYYLQTHTKDSILTVITDGEPYDVLPDLLLHDEETGKDLEPLSCDFRGTARQSRNVELPRLVAALLGCKYDDLVQRQRHYRLRRLIIIMTAVTVALTSSIAYLIWSNHQIKKNLDASLRQQSRNLALQSMQAMNDNDKLSAVRYALDALPSEGNERPVVASAVKALADAVNVYKTPESESWTAIRRYTSKGDTHGKIVTVDAGDNCYVAELFTNFVWALYDASSGKELMEDHSIVQGESILNLGFTESGMLVLLSEQHVYVLDPSEEKLIRDIPLEQKYSLNKNYRALTSYFDKLAIAGDSLWIPLGDTDGESAETACTLARIDLKEGKVSEEHKISSRPAFITVSPDGRFVAFNETDYFDLDKNSAKDFDPDMMTVADTKAGFTVTGKAESGLITDAVFIDGSHLVTCGLAQMPDPYDYSQFPFVELTGKGAHITDAYALKRDVRIGCIDAGSGTEVWKYEDNVRFSGLPWLESRAGDDCPWDIFCMCGSHMIVLDSKGSEMLTAEAESSIIELGASTPELFNAVLYNGEIMVYTRETDELSTSYAIFPEQIRIAERTDDYWFVTTKADSLSAGSEMLTQYSFSGRDESWEDYEYGKDASFRGCYDENDVSLVTAKAGKDNTFVEIRRERFTEKNRTNRKPAQILVRSSTEGDILANYSVTSFEMTGDGQNDYVDFHYCGIDPDAGKVYFADDHLYTELSLLSVDLDTGDEDLKRIPLTGSGDETYSEYRIIASKYNSENNAGLYAVEDGLIQFAAECRTKDPETSEEKASLAILSVDPAAGSVEKQDTSIAEGDEPNSYEYFVMNAKCRRLVRLEAAGKNGVRLACYGFDGDLIWVNEEVPLFIMSYTCTDDGTVILIEPGQTNYILHYYSARSGKETAQTDLGAINIASNCGMDMMDMSDDEIMVTVHDSAFLIDRESYELRTSIENAFIAYDPSVRQFMLGAGRNPKTGHVPYRTLNELIEIGRNCL